MTGTGRSGTNIVKEIFTQHSLVASLPFEHRYTIDPRGLVSFYESVDTWSPYQADYQLKDLEQFLLGLGSKTAAQKEEHDRLKANGMTGLPYGGWELKDWIPNYTDHVNTLVNRLKSFSYSAAYPGSDSGMVDNSMYYYKPEKMAVKDTIADFMESCHRSICMSQQKQIFLEDNTWSILFADSLLDLTPTAKLLHIVRDPRDVVASMQKQKWTPSELNQLLVYYTDIMNQWSVRSHNLSDTQFMTVRLEDLVSDSEATLSSICSFAEIQLEEKMLTVDLSKSNSGRFVEQFSTSDRDLMTSRLEPYLKKYNYV